MAAAMTGWFGTEIALPMSWHSDATTNSLSAPARSARVAVWRQWVSWSVAKPSTSSSRDRRSHRIRSATRPWFLTCSTPIVSHCSRVEASIRVNVVAMAPFSRPGSGMTFRSWDGATYDRISAPQARWGAAVVKRLVLEAVREVGDNLPGAVTFATPEETARRLEAAGFVDAETWLNAEPTVFDSREAFEEFLAAVCLGARLDRMPPDERAGFVRAVAD